MNRVALFVAVLFLSACSLFHKETAEFSCPKVGFVPEASLIPYTAENREASFQGFAGDCGVDKVRGEISLDLTLKFTVGKKFTPSPRHSEEPSAPVVHPDLILPYFIAVLSPEEEILQRQSFTTVVKSDETGGVKSEESHVILLPQAKTEDAYKYKVVIGFILTPDQLPPKKEKEKK